MRFYLDTNINLSKGIIMAKKKIYTKEELLAKMPKRMNKLGEWYFSDDPNKLQVVIHDMRAVLR